MKKSSLIVITILILAVFASIFILGSSDSSEKRIQSVVIKDGVQYITIDAKGGYSPKITEAKADIPTKLIMKTGGTFDCSASLVINSLNYRKILPQTGETEIDLGTPKTGEPIVGVCGMGMYSFQINFS